ncbi:PAS domain-containing sensor histidine kinase [Dehalococcoides mccartyi]|uniref:PAS domain-containing sensor histidine kinase n=1 Tax=Dehalococcoides mccartyi TaxID=61435 RepID=UPI0009BAD568|nr:PAS domain-containing sensor histidine kinase [Dehalococcoides mccartyi]
MSMSHTNNNAYGEIAYPLAGDRVYHRFFKEAHDGLALIDYTDGILGNIIDINDIMCEWLGYSRQELLGISNDDLIAPAYKPFFQRSRRNVRQRSESDRRLQFNIAFVAKDGHIVPFEVTAHIMKSEGFSFTIFRNVTDRKNMERRLGERYKKEKRLTEQLQEQMDRRIDFNRYLVHELKTPLTPLLGASEMLIAKASDITLKRLAENIYRGAKNLDARVDDLMCMVRGEMGLLRLKVLQIDIAELMQDTVLYLKHWAENKKHTLTLKITPNLPVIQGDESRLSQVMLNLIGNAIKFTSPGGIIDVHVAKYGERVKITIKDNGKGISPENQQWIFEPYSRRKQLSDEMSGLGIGLPLSKMIVRLHGGDIRVRSKPGTGSVFTVVLPLVVPFGESDRKEISL